MMNNSKQTNKQPTWAATLSGMEAMEALTFINAAGAAGYELMEKAALRGINRIANYGGWRPDMRQACRDDVADIISAMWIAWPAAAEKGPADGSDDNGLRCAARVACAAVMAWSRFRSENGHTTPIIAHTEDGSDDDEYDVTDTERTVSPHYRDWQPASVIPQIDAERAVAAGSLRPVDAEALRLYAERGLTQRGAWSELMPEDHGRQRRGSAERIRRVFPAEYFGD